MYLHGNKNINMRTQQLHAYVGTVKIMHIGLACTQFLQM